MGNYCSCVCSSLTDTKCVILEEKREGIKFLSYSEDPMPSHRSISTIYSSSESREVLLKSIARSVLVQKYLDSMKTFASFIVPCTVIYGPPPTSPQIQAIEDSLPKFKSPQQSTLKTPTVELPEGGYYQGPWDLKSEKQEGFGVLIDKDQSKFIGFFKQGKKNGRGRLIKMDGEVLEGDFFNDFLEGKGILIKSNGMIYKGEFKKGKENGHGTIEFKEEIVYTGNFLRGMKNGRGRLCLTGGNVYEGDFCNDFIDGYGKYVWKDGKEYIGGWKNNKLHGEGIYTWPDGREYCGNYVDGNREGFGVFKWPDGRQYKGQWAKGNMHGEGEYTCIDKKGGKITIFALWQDGKKIKVLN